MSDQNAAPVVADVGASPPAAPQAAPIDMSGTVAAPKVLHGKQRATRKQAQEMAKSNKRDVRRKGLRLLREASRNIVTARVKATRADAAIVALRKVPPQLRGEDPQPGEVVFGMRTGLLGHPTTTVLRVTDETIVGCCEDGPDALKQIGEIVAQVGMLTVAALFNYNLAWGPDGLGKAMAKWAGIDLEALKKAAAEEAAAEAAEAAEESTEGPTATATEEPTLSMTEEASSDGGSTQDAELGGEA